MMNLSKRLYKSNYNKQFDGVCGGIAEYLNVDPTIVRLLWVIFGFLGGSGILAYIVCMLIIPRNPGVTTEDQNDTIYRQN